MEIYSKHHIDRIVNISKRAHVVCKCRISETGFSLGSGDVRIDGYRLIIGEKANEAQNFTNRFPRLMPRQDHVGYRNRASIDERISRYAFLMFKLNDGVEGRSGALGLRAPKEHRQSSPAPVSE